MRIKSYKFLARVGFEPAIPDKEDRYAKHPTIGDGNSIAQPKSSQLDLSDTMHGTMDTMPDIG